MDNQIQRRRGRPANDNMKSANIRMPPELYVGVRSFMASQPTPPRNFSAAMRIIVRDWLAGHDYLSASEEKDVS